MKPIDIVRDSKLMHTIWRQEMNSTQEENDLKKLIDSYVSQVPFHYNSNSPSEEDYFNFYTDVLNKFKEDK
ncbi:hypothetical protein VPHG_00172 [Vibrio phage 11895-B1]|uniref:hypothetical protein n=1 Tax=Vibrio phage 11895-B1 TaxID=754075 RepID=UPI0002C0953F|nr:hypothetical protein VPHG_00172 [Vibrio phage 11895-B1]AGH32235.1 hypothetical protein VPHG_00172 [Vibrio phage 11895-B1]